MTNQNREQQLYHEVMLPAVNDLLNGFDDLIGNRVPGLKELAQSEKRSKQAALRAYTDALEQATTPEDIYRLLNATPQSSAKKDKGLSYVVQTYLVGDSPLAKKASITRRDYENSEEAALRHQREQLENLPQPDENLSVVVNHLIDRIADHPEMQADRAYLAGKKKDSLAAHEARRLLAALKRKFPDYSSHHGEFTFLQQILDKPKRNTPNQLEHIYSLSRDARPVYLLAVDEYIDLIENGGNTDLKLIPILAPLIGDAHATLDQIKQELRDIQAQHGNLRRMGRTLDDILVVVEGATTSPDAVDKLRQKVTSIRDQLNTIFPILGQSAQPETKYPLSDILSYLPLLSAAATKTKTERDEAQAENGRLTIAAGLASTAHKDEVARLRAEISTKDQSIGQMGGELARKIDYDDVKTERDRLTGENAQLQHAKDASEAAAANAKGDAARHDARAHAAEKETARTQAELRTYHATEQARIDGAKAPLEATVARLTSENANQSAELQRRHDYDANKAELAQRVAEKEAETKRADAAHAEAQRKEAERARIDGEFSQYRAGEQGRITAATDPIIAERDQARAEAQRKETERARFEQEKTAAESDSQRKNTELATYQANHNHTDTEYDAIEAERNQKARDNTQLEADKSALEARVRSLDREVQLLNDQVIRANAEKERMAQDLRRATTI